MTGGDDELFERVLAGDHRALARTISRIENRAPGYRELVAGLYEHTGGADVIGITGSPGAGKSTLVDKLAEAYREEGKTVGIIAIDPASPFTGGSVLGDRIRMASTVGDMDVFVRSMSARGALGGLSAATTEAVTAMDAFGKDVVIVETVGAGQNEIDVVKAADTVAVLVPPGSGDSVQTLKAGILEIADVFVVNKADREGSDRTVRELREMIEIGEDGPDTSSKGDLEEREGWSPPIVETVATEGRGVAGLMDAFDDHRRHLAASDDGARQTRRRHAEQIRTLLREDVHGLLEEELAARGGVEEFAEAVRRGEADPYTVVEDLLEPIERCLADREAGSPEPPR